MKISFETGIASQNKVGEELCGDVVEIQKDEKSTVIVLSDGLGSGVKANILATLTSRIASRLLVQGVPLQEVVETVSNTLPVCQVRKVAYSTYSILQIFKDGRGYLIQYDNPRAILIRNGKPLFLRGNERIFSGEGESVKVVNEITLNLQEGDILVFCSDGVTHAGIEALIPLGLGEEGLERLLRQDINLKNPAQFIAEEILEMCEMYSAGVMGDDTTAVVVKVRPLTKGVLLSGPPLENSEDQMMVEAFFEGERRRVVCGGTSANIVSRIKKLPITAELGYFDPAVPPIARMPGVDLVTEGVLTLTKVVEMLESGQVRLKGKRDGASLLLKWLLECDEIELLVGLRINPAHLTPGLPFRLGLRSTVLQRLCDLLRDRGKICRIRWY
ncbi:MAG: SpoIIE family protein phosphatase [Peptococcaceae bacterium]|mgnify:CR=1 FL=1|nr:SpoIIE family protein phosphatase [Peptococcaceae bacterium]